MAKQQADPHDIQANNEEDIPFPSFDDAIGPYRSGDDDVLCDFTNAREPTRVPNGIYRATVADIQDATSKASGNRRITVTFRIADPDPELDGLLISDMRNFTFAPSALYRTRERLGVLAGREWPDGPLRLTQLDELIDKPVTILVRSEEYQGRMRPNVQEVFRPNDPDHPVGRHAR